jgi:hypothetical protein
MRRDAHIFRLAIAKLQRVALVSLARRYKVLGMSFKSSAGPDCSLSFLILVRILIAIGI